MSYAVMGLGAAPASLILQWKDPGNNNQSAVVNPKGPVCGYQIASQVMLGDLGFGPGKSNTIDPAFADAFHQFAVARKIDHAAGAPVTDAMCDALLTGWQAIAAPSPTNKNVWVKTTPAPTPVQAPPGTIPPELITSQLKPLPGMPAAPGGWWAKQTPQTKMLVMGGGAAVLLLAVLVNLPKGG
jgi:hypothetical protein